MDTNAGPTVEEVMIFVCSELAIQPSDELMEELKLDSLSVLDLLIAVEDKYSVRFGLEDPIKNMSTIRLLAQEIVERIGAP